MDIIEPYFHGLCTSVNRMSGEGESSHIGSHGLCFRCATRVFNGQSGFAVVGGTHIHYGSVVRRSRAACQSGRVAGEVYFVDLRRERRTDSLGSSMTQKQIKFLVLSNMS